MGSLAAGGAAAMGTGAFSSVQADRDITIKVEGDAGAYLGVEASEGPNSQYVDTSGGEIELDFTSNDNNSDTGLNDEARIRINNILNITNNGTDSILVTVGIEDSNGNVGRSVAGLEDFLVFGGDDYDFARLAGTYDGDALPVGESESMGFGFNWRDDPNEGFANVVNEIDTMWLVAARSQSELTAIKTGPYFNGNL